MALEALVALECDWHCGSGCGVSGSGCGDDGVWGNREKIALGYELAVVAWRRCGGWELKNR